MKVLITGATGYVGRHLVKRLRNQQYELHALVRKTSNIDDLRKYKVNIIVGDISKKESLNQLSNDYDIIIHLAFSLFPKADPKINEAGFDNILNYSKLNSLKRFVFVSSALVYGNTPQNKAICESYHCNPHINFAKQELRAENKLLELYTQEKFPCVIIRPSEIYGGYGGIFKTAQLDGYIDGSVPIIGRGNNTISMTYIGDLVQAIISSITKDDIEGNAFNINTPGLITVNELIKLIKSKVKTKRIFKIPVFMGWIVASFAIIIAKIFRKTPIMDYDIVRIATTESGDRDIKKAIELLDFKPKYNDVISGLTESYFNNKLRFQ